MNLVHSLPVDVLLLLQAAVRLQPGLGGEGAGRVPEVLLLLLGAPQVLLVVL